MFFFLVLFIFIDLLIIFVLLGIRSVHRPNERQKDWLQDYAINETAYDEATPSLEEYLNIVDLSIEHRGDRQEGREASVEYA